MLLQVLFKTSLGHHFFHLTRSFNAQGLQKLHCMFLWVIECVTWDLPS